MKEKTIILFKPGAQEINGLYEYVFEKLKENNLTIDNKFTMHLSGKQLCGLWPRLSNDILLYYTALRHYKKLTEIIEISGENAIEKVKEIKHNVRIKYANNVIRNCIHAPKNSFEYNYQIKVIQDKDNFTELFFPQIPYDSYKKLTKDLCVKLATQIVDISLYKMLPYFSPYYLSTKKYRYYLVGDDSHSFTEYVCFICDYLKQYSLHDAVILSFILLTYGEVCIMDGNDKSDGEKILASANKHNIIIKCHAIT